MNQSWDTLTNTIHPSITSIPWIHPWVDVWIMDGWVDHGWIGRSIDGSIIDGWMDLSIGPAIRPDLTSHPLKCILFHKNVRQGRLNLNHRPYGEKCYFLWSTDCLSVGYPSRAFTLLKTSLGEGNSGQFFVWPFRVIFVYPFGIRQREEVFCFIKTSDMDDRPHSFIF